MAEFATYSRFFSEAEAVPFVNLFENAGIYYQLEKERNVLDAVYIGESPDPMVILKISPDDFERANALVETNFQPKMAEIDPEYYLFHFTNEELIGVINNTEEWNYFDRSLSKQILAQRNVTIPTEGVLKDEPGYTPIRVGLIWIILEIMISLYFEYAGIIIGMITILATKTLSNGKKVKIYDEITHRNAWLIIIIGIIRTAFHFYVLLF